MYGLYGIVSEPLPLAAFPPRMVGSTAPSPTNSLAMSKHRCVLTSNLRLSSRRSDSDSLVTQSQIPVQSTRAIVQACCKLFCRRNRSRSDQTGTRFLLRLQNSTRRQSNSTRERARRAWLEQFLHPNRASVNQTCAGSSKI